MARLLFTLDVFEGKRVFVCFGSDLKFAPVVLVSGSGL